MEREACVCDHGYERSDLCAEIIIIIIINSMGSRLLAYIFYFLWSFLVQDFRRANPEGYPPEKYAFLCLCETISK